MRTTVRTLTAALALAGLSSGCGDLAMQGRGPQQIVVTQLLGASGAEPDQLVGNVMSDVVTLVEQQVNGQTVIVPTIFNDVGSVTMELILKDPGQPGVAATPSALNSVTFTRYRVRYVRADGRNVEGVDVPYSWETGLTFTVPATGTVTMGFQLVRHTAKLEAPLRALVDNSAVMIQTTAELTFYGRDQAGNDVIATGGIGVSFGDWADPE